MCGIVGITNFRRPLNLATSERMVRNMANAVKHRGPDDEAYYHSPDGRVLFGHRRLSIVGLDDRPTIMDIPKKSNPLYRVAIVFNGEIYNFPELKKYFRKKGYRSVSPSDFEVIVFAWQEWGKECVQHLTGEFAFVLYDEETRELFMARDRTGVKPLFYGMTKKGEFVFGSEPKALLQYPNISKKVDPRSLAAFVLGTFSSAAGTAERDRSFFENIRQLKAGYRATVDRRGVQLDQYWDLPFGKKKSSNSVDRIRERVTNSILARIPREVPTGVGLSGGLDSSIVAVVAKHFRATKRLLAACIRYQGDKNEDYRNAKFLAEKEHIALKSPVLSAKQLIRLIDDCVIAMDGPFDTIRRMGMFANYATLKKHGYKVALIGEGADEFNLGYYHTFPGLEIDAEQCNTPEKLKKNISKRAKFVQRFFTQKFLRIISFSRIINNAVQEDYKKCPSSDPLDRMQYFYAKRFLQFLEDSNDRAAMANHVEARLPFVDHEVIAACLSVPFHQNVSKKSEKLTLHKAFAGVLPKEIVLRKKSPLPAAENMELHRLIAKIFVHEVIQAPPTIWKILQKKALTKLSQEYTTAVQSQNAGHQLNSWHPINGDVSLRTAHVMCFLTILRWFALYLPKVAE